MEWWKERHVNKRDYILDHFNEFNMSADETLMVLLIDFMNQNHISVTHELLSTKMQKSMDEIDELFTKLNSKGYVSIDVKDGRVMFQIDGLFEENKNTGNLFNESLFEHFENEFARPLSQIEVQRLSDWMKEYDQKLIRYALREALTYEKKSFDYIERILQIWKEKGLTAEMYEEGRR